MRLSGFTPEALAHPAFRAFRRSLVDWIADIERHYEAHPRAGLDPSHPRHIRVAREMVEAWKSISPENREFFVETGAISSTLELAIRLAAKST